MRKSVWGFSVSFAALCVVLPATAAFAQNETEVGGAFSRGDLVTVLDRPRPDYDALGIRAGAFLLFPKLEVNEAYDDNIFATQVAPKTDLVTSIAPSITAQSQWSQNMLSAGIHGQAFEYGRYNSEDSFTYGADVNGRLDVLRDTQVTSALTFDHLIDPRSDAASPVNAKDPVSFDQTGLNVQASREVDRIRVSGTVNFINQDYASVESVLGGKISQAYRNNKSWEESIRGDYAISPDLAVYATVINDDYEFNAQANGGINRNSSNDQFALGTDFQLSHLIRSQIQVGYITASFDQPGLKSAPGVSLLGKLEYFPTQLLTVTLNGQRAIQASGVIGAPATTTTTGGIQADYELFRNLILSASGQRAEYDYDGLPRTDVDYTGKATATFLVKRWLGLNLTYTYYDQGSVGAARGANFTDNRIQAGLVLQY